MSDTLERRVLRVLHQRGNPVPIGQIALEVNATLEATDAALLSLVDQGHVRQTRRGEMESGVIAYLPLAPRSPSVAHEGVIPEPPRSKHRSLTIAVDVDGVVADFLTPCCEIISEVRGKPFSYDECLAWDLFEAAGLTDEQTREVERRFGSQGWCKSLKPYDGARDGIASLTERGHEVYFLTSPHLPSLTWAHERHHWIQDVLGHYPVVQTKHKHYCTADVLVEDSQPNLIKWTERQGGRGILMDHPYNRTPDRRFSVAKTWADVVAIVDRIP